MADSCVACVGCGAQVPDTEGPTHAYLGASPGCWAIFGEILAKEYSDYRFASVHRLTVDTYAAQHPGQPERRTIQSMAVHLISLYVTLEKDFDNAQPIRVIRHAAASSAAFTWLDPPTSLGDMTVLDVQRAGKDALEHKRLVEAWARATWAAWSRHHPQVRQWASMAIHRS